MMKKVLAVILCLVLMSGFAFAEDYSAKTVEELQAMQDGIRNELKKRELVSEDKTLLFEHEGVSIYLTGEYDYFLGDLRLNTISINDTDKEYSMIPNDLTVSVNGWDVSCTSDIVANPRKKAKGHLDIDISKADIEKYEQVEEIEFRFAFKFKDDKTYTYTEPLTVYFNK